ncbi:MAG: PfaD family polyunsaturated fatty acid/polyketide biosynthesis protein [Oculatellaceae cyanobacterium Prado106]|nr:PfaD family polyunsaturated fatty acid/polyketide biosynthesis protein [Oculatellaceae cyanobacterium Prado106]
MNALATSTGTPAGLAFDLPAIKQQLLQFDQPCYVMRHQGQIGVTATYEGSAATELLATLAPTGIYQLGDPSFRAFHQVNYAYTTGAMAGGIASAELVIALGQAGMLASFGAGGVPPARLEAAIQQIQQARPHGPYAFNLIHIPSEPAMERGAVDRFLQYSVRTIEASAFLDLTPNLVYYRAAGLHLNANQELVIGNRIMAKVSRKEVAAKFLQPAPLKLLQPLVEQGLITELQAQLAQQVPMADDITVEADSGGHTDNRPLVALFPSILSLRDELQAQYQFANPVRIGAAGGISTPESALAAFMMGAAYIVTGSVNQSCLEAGTSPYVKQLLAEAEMPDVMMAPAADMFEMGVKLQVLKRGSLFAVRAQKLYDVYRTYDRIEDIPADERRKLETQIFKKTLAEVWDITRSFFEQRDPSQIAQAEANPKRKMALIFRWYLGLSSRWANSGETGRESDYQIWCGPAMGSFNDWVRGSYLAEPANRRATEVAYHILIGALYLYRVQQLKMQGIQLPPELLRYYPVPLSY